MRAALVGADNQNSIEQSVTGKVGSGECSADAGCSVTEILSLSGNILTLAPDHLHSQLYLVWMFREMDSYS